VHPRSEHAKCTSCHEPHEGAPRSQDETCKSCHATEHASALKVTAHAQCASCHTPHEGGTRAGAACASCHAPKASQNHGSLTRGCTSCHGIHAEQGVLATPSCTTCHAAQTLPSLHQLAGHAQCASCHAGAHSTAPPATRAACTACHADQKEHAAEAQLCNGCHVFTR